MTNGDSGIDISASIIHAVNDVNSLSYLKLENDLLSEIAVILFL